MLIRVSAVHRPSPDWKYDDYVVTAHVYHGTRRIGKPVHSQACTITSSLYSRILVNSW